MSMTKHRRLVTEIVERLRESEMECGVILFGSVQTGRERSDSDLDFCLIVQGDCDLESFSPTVLHREKGMTLFESRIEGIVVHFACWSAEAFERAVREEPFTFYPLAKGEIVHDVGGLASGFQQRLQEYFRARPLLSAAWEKQLAAVQRHRAGTQSTLAYAEWGDFAADIRGAADGAEEGPRSG